MENDFLSYQISKEIKIKEWHIKNYEPSVVSFPTPIRIEGTNSFILKMLNTYIKYKIYITI